MTMTDQSTTVEESERPETPDNTDTSRWTSRAVLTRMFVIVAVVAVLTLGFVNFLGARAIFSEAIADQLASLASDRGEAIRTELDRAMAEVSVAARDASIAMATRDFTETFLDLDGTSGDLQPDQEQALEQFYASRFGSIDDSTGADS